MLLACIAAHIGAAPATGRWTDLFDGKTLKGWEGNTDVFHVEDGAVVAGSLDAKIPRNEFLCSEREYADFELRLDFKTTGQKGKVNAGVQIRSRRIPDHHEMIGYQADIGQHYWGSLYDESRRRKILAKADMAALRPKLNEEGWNTYRMRCEGRRVRAHNGKDPGGTEPPSVYYYRFDRAEKKWVRYPLSEKGQIGFGINTMAGDIDGDGDTDIVAPGKSGLYLFVNELL